MIHQPLDLTHSTAGRLQRRLALIEGALSASGYGSFSGGYRPTTAPGQLGIVAELPSASPTDPAILEGARCIYKPTTGVFWDLVYTGEEVYPWAKVGGPPLRTSSLKLLTPPLNMEAAVSWGAGEEHQALFVAGKSAGPEALHGRHVQEFAASTLVQTRTSAKSPATAPYIEIDPLRVG